jgi:hypothetical protein
MTDTVTAESADAPRYNIMIAKLKWQHARNERGRFAVDNVPTDGKPRGFVLEMLSYTTNGKAFP